MQTYILNPSGLAAQQRRGLQQSLLLYGFVIVCVLAIANRGDFSIHGLVGLLVAAATSLLLAGLLMWAGLRSLRVQWATYQLILDGDQITRRASRVPDVQINWAQITTIEEYPDTGLMLRTADKRTFVFIPAGLMQYEDVREQLATIKPIIRKQSSTQLFLRCLGAACIPVVAISALELANTTATIVIVGTLFIAGALWVAVQVQRSRTVPRWFKVLSWLFIPLVLLIIALRLIMLP